MRACGLALVGRQPVAPDHAFDAALDDYVTEMATLRHRDPSHDLPIDALERVFTLAFALEQLRQNFCDP